MWAGVATIDTAVPDKGVSESTPVSGVRRC